MSDKKLKKDSVNPELAPKERKIKELQSKIDSGTYKPDSAKIADKMVEGAKKEKAMKKDEMMGEPSEPGDMQMSEKKNEPCKKCGEKLCKCLAMSEKADLCKKCGGSHSLAKCAIGKSMNQMRDLEKARVDEGKDLESKVRDRQVRNKRDVQTTKTPTGQDTRTAKTSYKRMKELEVGPAAYDKFDDQGRAQRVRGIPAERRKGEKIVGTPKEMAEKDSGVHIRGGTYAKEKNVVGGGKRSIGAMSEPGGNKSWRSGGPYHSYGGDKAAHRDVMDAQKKIKPMMKSELQPGMSLNDLRKAEQGLMKAEAEAMDLAAQAREALAQVRAKLPSKK